MHKLLLETIAIAIDCDMYCKQTWLYVLTDLLEHKRIKLLFIFKLLVIILFSRLTLSFSVYHMLKYEQCEANNVKMTSL